MMNVLKRFRLRMSLSTSILFAASMVFGSFSAIAPVSAANTTYYVSTTGSDSNNGTSTATPWKTLSKVNGTAFAPGDQVLFKSGDTWSGQLEITSSGSSSSPITFAAYGTGSKPLFNGGGIDATVLLDGVSYVTVDGLAVTNYDGLDVYDGAEGDRAGIKISGTVSHIVISNNEVYYIEGCSNHTSVGSPRGTSIDPNVCNIYVNGAIYQYGSGSSYVTIQNNYVHDVTNTAIMTRQVGAGVLIENNTVVNGGADGIEYINAVSPVIQYNSVTHVGNNSGTSPRGPGVLGYNGLAVAGIWGYKTTDQLAQYNYVEGTNRIQWDGQAWDFDSGTVGGVYQYSFSRDNEGGFVLGGHPGQILRYNISYNDGSNQSSAQGFFNGNSSYYNNVFYQNNGAGFIENMSDADFKNNIFYTNATGNTSYQSTGVTFSNNCFGGSQTALNTGTNPVVGDPLFVNPSSAGHTLNSVDGFKLQAGSPCIDAGLVISGNGGQDYWGNPLYNGTPDIGAYELPAGSPPPAANSVTAYKTATTLTIDGNLSESAWTIDQSAAKTISGSPNNTVTFGATWDDTYLYVGIQALDGTLNNDSTPIYDDDSFDIYIDADHNQGTTYDSYDRMFQFGYNDGTIYEKNSHTSGVQQETTAVTGGYSGEIAIPWSNLGITPTNNMTIGFDVANNDDDNGGTRDSQLMWNGTGNNYLDTSAFGELVLSTGAPSSPGTATAVKTSGAMTIDGNLSESAWTIDQNAAKTISGSPNNTVTFGATWDDTYLYVGIQALDGTLNSDSTPIYDDDSFDVYVDADHNQGTTYDSYDRMFQFGYNDGTIYEINSHTSGVQQATAVITGGYSGEIAIPWSNLGITPTDNMTIGFDVANNDDDDGGTRDSQLMWYGTGTNYLDTSAFGELVLDGGNVSGSAFDDDFESDSVGSAPSGWTVTTPGGTATVESTADGSGGTTKALKLTSATGTGSSSSATATFTSLSGTVTIDVRMKASQAASYGFGPILLDSANAEAVYLGFKDNGQLAVLDTIGAWNDLTAYTANQWYDLHIVADTDTDTFDLSVNGTSVATSEPFRSAVSSISAIKFGPYRWDIGTFYYDDIVISN